MNWTSADVNKVAKRSAAPPARPVASAAPVSPVGSTEAGRTLKKRRQDEAALQVACITWFRMQYPEYAPLLFAIPNGGRRGKLEAARLKREGVTAGVPDCLLAVPTNSAPALFLELKVGKNRPSEAQAAMLARLASQGYSTAVVYSFDAFRAAVTQHLGY